MFGRILLFVLGYDSPGYRLLKNVAAAASDSRRIHGRMATVALQASQFEESCWFVSIPSIASWREACSRELGRLTCEAQQAKAVL